MARRTFISYKYSEAQNLRDAILRALGSDASYYRGETSDSPDLTDYKTETIRNHLKDMIYGTSVTIVILSPHMNESKWIPWEIGYSLYCANRNGIHSKQNGIVAVVQKVNGSYDWLQNTHYEAAKGMNVVSFKDKYMPDIICKNRYNATPPVQACSECKATRGSEVCTTCRTYDFWNGSYITIVDQDRFLANPSIYIENAYSKSQKISSFDVTKRLT